MIRPIIVALCSLFVTVSVYAQGGTIKTTGQKYVTAIVDPGSGWVQFKIFPGKNTDGTLSYYQKSFVSFSLGDSVFTNNDVGLSSPLPAKTVIIKDGVLTTRKGQKLNTDTIVCTWPNKNGVDLIQEVYPVLLEKSEQIVFRWKALNKRSDSVVVAVQYLLDVQVGDVNYTNDGAPLLTRYGYRPNWDMFTPTTGTGIPWFYIGFQYPLPNGPFFDPGLSGMGLTDNSYVNLGLTKPIRQTIGNWPDLIRERWGPPIPLPNGHHDDVATLLEFNSTLVKSNKESLIAATSYGTGEFATCKGQLFGVIFYPLRVRQEGADLKPNPFTIDFFAFNPNQITGAPNTKIELKVGTNLTIVSPSPITDSGKTQRQDVQPVGYIAPLGVGTATWTVRATKPTKCTGDITSSLTFWGQSPGLGYPIFINDATGSDTCEHPIIIDCKSPLVDIFPPIIDNPVIVSRVKKYVSGHDNRVDIDTGMKTITWQPRGSADSTTFAVTLAPPIVQCTKTVYTVTVEQRDSTRGGCIDVIFNDCMGNISDTTLCFESRIYVPADTLPPLTYDHATINKRKKEFKVLDNRTDDKGIKEALYTVRDMDTAEVVFIPHIDTASKVVHVVVVSQTDTSHYGCVLFQISDMAGNVTLDSICFTVDTSLAVGRNAEGDQFSILGNPSSGRATIRLTLEKAQNVTLKLIDILGKEVRRYEYEHLPQGMSELPLILTDVASGTYYLILEIDGKQLIRSLKVIR
jgi:hypothetical protein